MKNTYEKFVELHVDWIWFVIAQTKETKFDSRWYKKYELDTCEHTTGNDLW